MKKNNSKKLSLLLLSAMMALSTNSAFAIDQVPTSIDTTVTDDTSINNGSLTEYFVQYDDSAQQVGGAIYNVTSTGTLNVAQGSNVVYNNIAAMVNLPLASDPAQFDKVGRYGGVIYNAGNLYIGSQVNGNTTTFSNNIAGQGGALENSGTAYIYNTTFSQNTAKNYKVDGKYDGNFTKTSGWEVAQTGRGGAIVNFNQLTVSNSTFDKNAAETYGGAVYNGNGGEIVINNSDFTDNTASNQGGAIYNNVSASSPHSGTVDINGGSFENNYAKSGGGAIYNLSSDDTGNNIASLTINGATFKNNSAAGSGFGGAIYNGANLGAKSEARITSTTFENNGLLVQDADNTVATNNGGAIYNTSTVVSNGSTFTGNKATGNGGAIYNSGTATITDTTFTGNGGSFVTKAGGVETNQRTSSGGAVYNSGTLNLTGGSFTNNDAIEGGALYNSKTATLTDVQLSGNTADRGGAIYGATGSETTVIAQDTNVNFATATDSIYLGLGTDSQAAPVLNLNAHEGRNVNLNGDINAATTITESYIPVVNVNYNNANYTGNVNFNNTVSNVKLVVHNGIANAHNTISNTTVTTQGGVMKFHNDQFLGTNETLNRNNVVLNGGTLDIQQGVVSNIALKSFELKSDTNLKVDVDLANETMDNFDSANIASSVIDPNAKLNITDMRNVDSNPNVDEATIFFTNLENLTADKVSAPDRLNGTIYQYAVQKKTGAQAGFGGDKSDDVFFQFNKIGASDNITPKPIAQLGAFLLFDNIYRQSFANMDMLSILTRDERETLKRYNRYSNMFDDEINTFYQDKRQEDYPSVFVRGFTNLEHVRMDHGPKVSNVTYGTLIGHESGLYELGKGWDANYAVFGAYTGAHQTYNGIGVWQNGGSVGGVFTAYKGDFWAGLTANVGGWAVEAHNDFGHEHFPMLGTGVAMKTGYNIRMFDNKFILQPSYMMSYTFVYAYSHDNAAGVHIKQDPLHAIEFIPGVKLIANNFRGGWQPYLAVNMTWMTMEGGSFWADSAVFDRYTIKPFVEYGLGVQKHHGERATGFLQAMVRNGGRTGVALTGGFRWAIGDDIID